MNGVVAVTAIDRRAGFPERQVSQAGLSLLRHWLEQIVLTLPEPRQRMYDLFVARDLDTPTAAVELRTSVAEVRRLRRENRQAVLRAFEVTALAAAESAPDRPWNAASGCRELRLILTAGQHDGDLREGGEHRFVVLSAALRVTVSRHLSQCTACQRRRDDCMASWAPELLATLGGAGPSEPVAPHKRPMPVQHGSASGPPRRVSSASPARTVTVRLATATGAGLLAALPLLAFVWPGFAHEHHSSAGPSSLALSGQSSTIAPQAAGTAGDGHGQPVRHGASGAPSSPSRRPTVSMPAQLYTPLPPPVYYTLPPSASPTPSLSQQTSGPSPTGVPSPTPSWVPSTPKPRKTSPAPHPSTSTAPSSSTPTATPTSTASAAPSPTPSDTPSATASAPPSTPDPSSPDPTASDSAMSSAPESSAPTPEPSPTPAESAAS